MHQLYMYVSAQPKWVSQTDGVYIWRVKVKKACRLLAVTLGQCSILNGQMVWLPAQA